MAKLKVLDEIEKLWDATSKCIRIYKSLAEINPSFTINTPVKDVILAMDDNSMAIYKTPSDSTGVYPTVLGTIIITKQNIDRSYVQCSHPADGIWYTSYHAVMNSDCEWKKLIIDVTNSYEETTEGKALDAMQNNKNIDGTLANKIDYMYTHGYVKESKRYDDEDEEFLNSLNENGKYTVSLNGVPNIVNGWYNVDVTMHSPNTHGNQILKGMAGDTVNKMYIRTKEESWYDAKEIAMQNITTITPDNFRNGWSQFNGHQQTKVIKIGNIVHLVGYVNVGVTTAPTTILAVPVYYRPKIVQAFDRWNITLRLNTDGNLILYSVASGVSHIDFSGIYWEV